MCPQWDQTDMHTPYYTEICIEIRRRQERVGLMVKNGYLNYMKHKTCKYRNFIDHC